MREECGLHAAIDSIYEAVLEPSLWPFALNRLADAIGVAQILIGTFDPRTNAFGAVAPRVDPLLVASYENYWAFRAPIWPRMATQPTGEPLAFTSLIPREEYVATAIYEGWFRLTGLGFSIIGANLRGENHFATTIFAANPPDNDHISGEQMLAFKAALSHFNNAFRVHRQLRVRDLNRDIAPERLEHMGFGVILVDSEAKVLYANAWARALLTPGSGLTMRGGYLFSTDRAAILHRLIRSCAWNVREPGGPGGAIALRRCARRPLRVTVTSLRARGNVAELPWLGLRMPSALVTIEDPAVQKRLN